LTSLPNLDWAAFSRSLGGEGMTVTKPEELAFAFATALKSSKPTVIDVKSDKHFMTPVEDWAKASAAWSYQE
jgi:thiamine pyrophosphate-dependent acetolactate synthase large subunit-like protein